MPCAWPVWIAEYICAILPSRIRLRMAGVPIMISCAAMRPPPTFFSSVCEMTARSDSESMERTMSFSSPGNTSTMRSMVLAAELVCSVPNTRWPVSAAVSARRMVSRSRISPTSTTSGSSRSAERSASEKPRVSRCTSRWFIEAALGLVHEFDRILDRDDVIGPVVVAVVDHAGERGGLARARGAGHQHQAARQHAQVAEDLRRLQVVERDDGRGNVAEHGAGAAVLVEGVDAEARQLRESRRKSPSRRTLRKPCAACRS